MPYTRSAAMAQAEPAGIAVHGNAREAGLWHRRPHGLPSIVQ